MMNKKFLVAVRTMFLLQMLLGFLIHEVLLGRTMRNWVRCSAGRPIRPINGPPTNRPTEAASDGSAYNTRSPQHSRIRSGWSFLFAQHPACSHVQFFPFRLAARVLASLPVAAFLVATADRLRKRAAGSRARRRASRAANPFSADL